MAEKTQWAEWHHSAPVSYGHIHGNVGDWDVDLKITFELVAIVHLCAEQHRFATLWAEKYWLYRLLCTGLRCEP